MAWIALIVLLAFAVALTGAVGGLIWELWNWYQRH